MKNKILTIFTCIALALTLTGCSAPPAGTTTTPEMGTTITTPPTVGTTTPPNTEIPTTGTEAPTETEVPEPPQTSTTPEEVTNTDTLLRCTASSLNVRKGAGTSYAIVGTLDKGDMVMPISKADGWYEIMYLGGSAYISASYVEEATFEKANDKIEQVITEGKKLLGIPYVYGAQRYHYGNGSLNPAYDGKSYDCSSLMQYIFKIGANVNLAMTSREQSLQGKEITRQDIRRGDLLFFTNASRFNNTGLERIGHVALYLGDNMILHTASDHAVIEQISATRNSYFITARRLID
ncbi:MAG: C40 family peptidase [Clostridiales bacterium]|nr:C40 family peptidase [Clostridiales bacterium]